MASITVYYHPTFWFSGCFTLTKLLQEWRQPDGQSACEHLWHWKYISDWRENSETLLPQSPWSQWSIFQKLL